MKLRLYSIFILLFALLLTYPNESLCFRGRQKGLRSETNGVFFGITQNQYHFAGGGEAEGAGWQGGIIQKTEKRPYGYLTGLLFFENIIAKGSHPTKGDVEFRVKDLVFSLWLTIIWRERATFSPMISLGPAFVLKFRSAVYYNGELTKYNKSMFDLKGQFVLGAYIKLKRKVFLNPQIFSSYNLLNNNHFVENWDVEQEINYGIQIGLLYTTDY